jgi:flagellar motor switch protein FliN/FliY
MADNPTDETTETPVTADGVDADLEKQLQGVAAAAEGVSAAGEQIARRDAKTIDYIMDVTLAVTIEVGRARMSIQDLLQLGQGSVIELQKLAGEPLDIFINGKRVATGEAVIVNEKFGVRLKEIIEPQARITGLSS